MTVTKRKECFIICPIGSIGSITRRKSDGLINSVLKPVLSERFDSVIAPLDIIKPGSITNQVIDLLFKADLVVANLTELNPNVMYELAVRHATMKPVVMLAEIGTELPFDIYSERALFYYDDMAGSDILKPDFLHAVDSALKEEKIDNPIERYQGREAFIKSNVSSSDSYLIEKLERFENILNSVAFNSRPHPVRATNIPANFLFRVKKPDGTHFEINELISSIKQFGIENVISYSSLIDADGTYATIEILNFSDTFERVNLINNLRGVGYQLVNESLWKA